MTGTVRALEDLRARHELHMNKILDKILDALIYEMHFVSMKSRLTVNACNTKTSIGTK